MVQVRLGHEVFFESCIIGLDEKDVVYIRTTGLKGPVEIVRIKPSDLLRVADHLRDRQQRPKQGQVYKIDPRFTMSGDTTEEEDDDAWNAPPSPEALHRLEQEPRAPRMRLRVREILPPAPDEGCRTRVRRREVHGA